MNLDKYYYIGKIKLIILFAIILWILLAIILTFSPLEFSDEKYLTNYYTFRLWCLPILVFLYHIISIFNKKDLKQKLVHLLTSFGYVFITVIIMFISMLGSMCGNIESGDFFVNKNNISTKIVRKHLDCGAVDGDYPKYKMYKVVPIGNYFIWSTIIDTNSIDKSEWIRMKDEN